MSKLKTKVNEINNTNTTSKNLYVDESVLNNLYELDKQIDGYTNGETNGYIGESLCRGWHLFQDAIQRSQDKIDERQAEVERIKEDLKSQRHSAHVTNGDLKKVETADEFTAKHMLVQQVYEMCIDFFDNEVVRKLRKAPLSNDMKQKDVNFIMQYRTSTKSSNASVSREDRIRNILKK